MTSIITDIIVTIYDEYYKSNKLGFPPGKL